MTGLTQLSELSRMDLVESFYTVAQRFYKDPKNKEAFERWLEERRRKEANG